jgi:hypothetical protein
LFDFEDPQELFITWSGWTKRELAELFGEPARFNETRFYRLFNEHRSNGIQELYDAIGIFPPDDCRFEAAALAGVPMELPYHDPDLLCFVRQLPRDYRMKNGDTKIILRQLFAQYFPQALLTGKKHYFNIPLQRFLAEQNYMLVRETLAPERLVRHGIVYPGRAWRWIERYLAGEEPLKFKVWALMVLHAWLDDRK